MEKFVAELSIKNTFIDVENIEAEYSETFQAYTRFHKISGPSEVMSTTATKKKLNCIDDD